MTWGARERRKAEGPVAGAGDGFSALGRSSVKERWTMAQPPMIEAHHPLLRRREALLALGGGIGAIWYASRRVRAIRSAFAVPSASAAVPCVLTPERIEGATVEIWHCDAGGNYSGFSSGSDRTFLRGQQTTNGAGRATFETIYP